MIFYAIQKSIQIVFKYFQVYLKILIKYVPDKRINYLVIY
jgi:hypothetical protein